jgi:hypothetical protein
MQVEEMDVALVLQALHLVDHMEELLDQLAEVMVEASLMVVDGAVRAQVDIVVLEEIHQALEIFLGMLGLVELVVPVVLKDIIILVVLVGYIIGILAVVVGV